MSAREYSCAHCGKAGTAAGMVYSRFTGNRYCREYDACMRRSERAKRKQRKQEAAS